MILLIIGFLLVFSSLIRITRSFVCLMEIFTHFSEYDLKKIIKYCIYLSQIFTHLGVKYDNFKGQDAVSNVPTFDRRNKDQNDSSNNRNEPGALTGSSFVPQIDSIAGD